MDSYFLSRAKIITKIKGELKGSLLMTKIKGDNKYDDT